MSILIGWLILVLVLKVVIFVCLASILVRSLPSVISAIFSNFVSNYFVINFDGFVAKNIYQMKGSWTNHQHYHCFCKWSDSHKSTNRNIESILFSVVMSVIKNATKEGLHTQNLEELLLVLIILDLHGDKLNSSK